MLRADQGFDAPFEVKGQKRIFLCHMDIKFPDLLGLGSKEIIVLEQLPDLEQKVRMHQVDLIAGAFCLFLQVLAVVF